MATSESVQSAEAVWAEKFSSSTPFSFPKKTIHRIYWVGYNPMDDVVLLLHQHLPSGFSNIVRLHKRFEETGDFSILDAMRAQAAMIPGQSWRGRACNISAINMYPTFEDRCPVKSRAGVTTTYCDAMALITRFSLPIGTAVGKYDSLCNMWAIGGAIERGESEGEAIHREFREEAGITPDSVTGMCRDLVSVDMLGNVIEDDYSAVAVVNVRNSMGEVQSAKIVVSVILEDILERCGCEGHTVLVKREDFNRWAIGLTNVDFRDFFSEYAIEIERLRQKIGQDEE